MIADDKRAIVGSINLSPGSFDDRREPAVETSRSRVVRRLVETAEHDWKHSRKLPLSDAAVLADLEDMASRRSAAWRSGATGRRMQDTREPHGNGPALKEIVSRVSAPPRACQSRLPDA